MDVFRSVTEAKGKLVGCALAIGNFDGVHMGHRRLIETTRDLAAARGGRAALLTFEPHPSSVLSPDLAPRRIATVPRKLELLRDAGLDAVVLQPFDKAYAATTPEEFVRRDLVGNVAVRDVVVGYDFTFGKGRSGSPAVLAEYAHPEARIHVVPAVTEGGLVVSSSKIRELLLEGRVEPAARLLTRPFVLDGKVVHGRGRGRTIGIPTANVDPYTDLVPATGVYAVVCASDAFAGLVAGAANVGVKPTFGPGEQTVEVHLFDFSGDLYGRTLSVGFLERIRGEERFPGVEALVAQVRKDLAAARAAFARASVPPFAAIGQM